ncbi:MAG: DNA alkylation repair protein [Parcubacteria group bacterium]|nr:DNA alkylation repair protein [Parcubacteria group bacterium]MCR4343013.1 DNA alkylation repair protein [Patescibacteria group bacterium]
MLKKLKKDLRNKADSDKAKVLQGFFKTGVGQYGEGDVFLGVTVPESRKIAVRYEKLSFPEISELLKSKIHEERFVALLVLVHNFKEGDEGEMKKIFNFYLKNTRFINNWDLVDLSADKIVGAYLSNMKDREVLHKLAKSKNLWERRIAIVATFNFIKNDEFRDTLKIAEILLEDDHDLIHKAVGWMLREAGKRSLESEESFLRKHYKKMPRTMLRYAIERFPEKKRQAYLKKSAS